MGCTTSFAGKTPQVTALTESESTLLCTCSMGNWQSEQLAKWIAAELRGEQEHETCVQAEIWHDTS